MNKQVIMSDDDSIEMIEGNESGYSSDREDNDIVLDDDASGDDSLVSNNNNKERDVDDSVSDDDDDDDLDMPSKLEFLTEKCKLLKRAYDCIHQEKVFDAFVAKQEAKEKDGDKQEQEEEAMIWKEAREMIDNDKQQQQQQQGNNNRSVRFAAPITRAWSKKQHRRTHGGRMNVNHSRKKARIDLGPVHKITSKDYVVNSTSTKKQQEEEANSKQIMLEQYNTLYLNQDSLLSSRLRNGGQSPFLSTNKQQDSSSSCLTAALNSFASSSTTNNTNKPAADVDDKESISLEQALSSFATVPQLVVEATSPHRIIHANSAFFLDTTNTGIVSKRSNTPVVGKSLDQVLQLASPKEKDDKKNILDQVLNKNNDEPTTLGKIVTSDEHCLFTITSKLIHSSTTTVSHVLLQLEKSTPLLLSSSKQQQQSHMDFMVATMG